MSEKQARESKVARFFSELIFGKEADEKSPSPEDALPKTEDTEKLDGSESALKPKEEKPLEGPKDDETKVKTGKPEDGLPEETDVHPPDEKKLDGVDAEKMVKQVEKDIGTQTNEFTQDKGAGDPIDPEDINVINTYRSKIAAGEDVTDEMVQAFDAFIAKQSMDAAPAPEGAVKDDMKPVATGEDVASFKTVKPTDMSKEGSDRVKLPDEVSKFFQGQPESGMGYQTVVNGEYLLTGKSASDMSKASKQLSDVLEFSLQTTNNLGTRNMEVKSAEVVKLVKQDQAKKAAMVKLAIYRIKQSQK